MSAVGSILTNTGALQALNSISTTSSQNTSLQGQLASGMSINSPADNPAGYITAQGFTSQLNGLTQALSNANQGVSLLQTAQGAITQQISVVQQLNSIAVQAANGTQTASEAQSLQTLVGQLTGQVSTIANQTQFNNINLMNGSFSGVQFQVGANEGQTMTLSINNLTASAIGMNYASATGGKTGQIGSAYAKGGATFPTTGEFSTTSSAKISGPNGGSATLAKSKATESAATLASSINAVSSKTGVQAQAYTQATLSFTAGASNNPVSFTVQAASSGASSSTNTIGKAVTVTASSAAGMVSQINGQSSTSGIVASLNSSGALVLTQSAGQNINITNFSGSGSLKQGATALVSGTNKDALIQGRVQLQSSGAFSVSNASALGWTGTNVTTKSNLASLSSVNVSTTSSANAAINIVKYSLGALNNQGGQLGAVQQALTANINNMNTTSQNLTTALGVVQDANIPAVSNKLTEAQIQAQAGVAALKSSTTLQQSYLSLLP
ncbi:flagellin [Acidocella sp.]|uniref:flagellin N-terminal helical domain-containing protein n=1 Tax=Acidocella sp. TaxID=50710 RepID=UPI0026388721|nr:flagellin [Acidocella sp.]